MIRSRKLAMGMAATMLSSTLWAQAPASVAPGNYECWANGSARMLLNFKVIGNGQYSDPDGQEKGSFSYNPATGAISFKGGHLDGVMPKGFSSIYHEPKKHPTVSFRGTSGAEASFCERVGK